MGNRRVEIVIVYAIGLFQGLSLVAVPAAASILTSPSGYDLSSSRYGALFVPQVILAIAGSIAVPALARRTALKHVLLVGVAANVVAMSTLVLSEPFSDRAIAYPMLLVATGGLGLGFGVTLASISTYAGGFMPDRRDVSLNALNVLLGLGTALSPLLVALFVELGEWWYLPLVAATGLVLLFVACLPQPLPEPSTGAPATATPERTPPHVPSLLYVFAAALVFYGVAETMFGNWGTTELRDTGVHATSANLALAAFWASVTIGRLLIAVTASRVPSRVVYAVLPWCMAGALLLASVVEGAGAAIIVFALAGLACSGFFPMTVGYGESTFPRLVELAAGWLIAAYQVGYGLAAFGGGVLQHTLALSTVFRVAAALCVLMGVLAVPIARRQGAGSTKTPLAPTHA